MNGNPESLSFRWARLLECGKTGRNVLSRESFFTWYPPIKVKWMANFLAIISLFLTSGCWTDKHGTRHHLVIGLGFASFSTNHAGVRVSDVKLVGAEIGQAGLYAGLMQHHTVVIDPRKSSNVTISVNATPFSLKVANFDPYAQNPISNP